MEDPTKASPPAQPSPAMINTSRTTGRSSLESGGVEANSGETFEGNAVGNVQVLGVDSLEGEMGESARGEMRGGGSGGGQWRGEGLAETADGVGEGWARIGTLPVPGPSGLNRPSSSLGGDRGATSSPSSSRDPSPPQMDTTADSYFNTINIGVGRTHSQSGTFDIPFNSTRPLSNSKGKERAHDDSPLVPADSPALPAPLHHPDDSPYSSPHSASAAPIRCRRVGALGISVSSSSGEPSSNDIRRKGRSQRGWSDEDRRRSAQDRCEWGEGSIGSAGNLDSAGGFANGRVDQPGVSEAGFRGIVDELALQSECLPSWRCGERS